MEEVKLSKRTSTIITIIAIGIFLLAVFGVTYAYFTINVINPIGSSMNIGIKDLGEVTFLDGSEIDFSNIFPGTTKTKEFTISRTGVSDDYEMGYNIYLVVRENTLTDAAHGEFVYSLSGTQTDTGILASASNVEVPNTTSAIGAGKFIGNGVHTYTFSISLNETGSNQNSTRTKGFSGYLQVVSTKKYAYQSSDDYEHVVVIDTMGGTYAGDRIVALDSGDTLEITPPTKTGYIFGGWALSGSGSIISDTGEFTMGTSNATLTANWYNSNGLMAFYDAINNTGSGHDNSTTTWYDLSGNSNTGIITDGTWGSNYLSFNGSTSWVNIGLHKYVTPTIEVVFSVPVTNSSTSTTVLVGNVQNGGYALFLSAEGTISSTIYSEGYKYAYTGVLPTLDTLYHTAMSYTGTALNIYLNDSSPVTTLVNSAMTFNDTTVTAIGANPNGTSATPSFFNGKIYSVRIYNRVLSDTEILSNYKTDKNRFGF